MQELNALQVIILYVYQKISKVDDANVADEGNEWEEGGDAVVEETEVEPPPKTNRSGCPSNIEKEMQKLLEDEGAARLLLQEQIIALQKAQAVIPAVKKSVAPSLSFVTPDEGVQKGMASSLTVGGVAVTNSLKLAPLTACTASVACGSKCCSSATEYNLQNALLPDDD